MGDDPPMIQNLPNGLTALRILLAPAVGALVVLGGPQAAPAAFGVFCVAALTDFLDGRLARLLRRETAIGRIMDSAADKIAVTLVLAALMTRPENQTWGFLVPAFVVLMRETFVSALRQFLGEIAPGGARLEVTPLAKWKTTAQMVAIAGLLPGDSVSAFAPSLAPILAASALALLWVAAGLTAISGWDYLRKGVEAMRQGEGGG